MQFGVFISYHDDLQEDLGWPKCKCFDFSPLPGHFPIAFGPLIRKMSKKVQKVDVLSLLQSILCLYYNRVQYPIHYSHWMTKRANYMSPNRLLTLLELWSTSENIILGLWIIQIGQLVGKIWVFSSITISPSTVMGTNQLWSPWKPTRCYQIDL